MIDKMSFFNDFIVLISSSLIKSSVLTSRYTQHSFSAFSAHFAIASSTLSHFHVSTGLYAGNETDSTDVSFPADTETKRTCFVIFASL